MKGDFDYLLWAYRAVFTQTNAGGGNVRINISANERMVLLYGVIGPDNYDAARAVQVSMNDSAGNNIAFLTESISIDNAKLVFPLSGEGAAISANSANEFNKTIVIGKSDVVRVSAVGLIQNETVTVQIRALFRNWPPTVTTTGSGGTVTTTTTYDKVI